VPSDPPASTRATGAQRWLARLTLAAIAAAALVLLVISAGTTISRWIWRWTATTPRDASMR